MLLLVTHTYVNITVLCTYCIYVILLQASGLIMLHKALIPESLMAFLYSLKTGIVRYRDIE